MSKTVKEMTQEHIKQLEVKLEELKQLRTTLDVGILNIEETLEKDKKYLSTLTS